MNDITFEWKIKQLGTQGPQNQVLRVYWSLVGTKNHSAYSIHGFTDLPEYSMDQQQEFIPFDELDHSTVLNWVQDRIGAVLDGYRSLITKHLNQNPKKSLTAEYPTRWI
jgi:protein tyrosine phosphatase